MNYLLDTCVLSELYKIPPEPAVVEWIEQQNEDSLYISVLSLGEIQKGIAKSKDARHRARLQTWLDEDLRQRFASRLLGISFEVAFAWGTLQGESERLGRRLPAIDSLIAATAQVSNATVVTRNVKDFEPCGVPVFNPWTRG